MQVLRAVAALMVVFHHARLSVPGSDFLSTAGESGVDIFFVISGFVMAYTTARLPGGASLNARLGASWHFVLNRVLRVVPLYWLALAWTAHRGFGTRFTAGDIARDLVFIPHVSTEFPRWIYPVLVQGWTLNYEMFFYLLFAISLLGADQSRKIMTACIVALVGVGIGWAIQSGVPPLDETQRWTGYGTQEGASALFAAFYTNNIMLEFCFGVALESAFRKFGYPAWPRWGFVALSLLGLVALSWLHLAWPRGVLQGLAATLIVWASIPACDGLRLRLLELLGNASYSIYLFHWASFPVLKPFVERLGSDEHGPVSVTVLVAAHVVVAAAAGVAIHISIEKPLTRWLKRRVGRRRSTGAIAEASP